MCHSTWDLWFIRIQYDVQCTWLMLVRVSTTQAIWTNVWKKIHVFLTLQVSLQTCAAICVLVCEWVYYMRVSMRRSGNSLQESVLSFYPVGFRGQTQIITLGAKCLYSMSYGTNLGLYNLFWRSFLTKIKLWDSPTSYTNKLLNTLNKCLFEQKSPLNIYFSNC